MFFDNVINLSIFAIITQVLHHGSCSSPRVRQLGVDIGSNITLPCEGTSKLTNVENVVWVSGPQTKQITHPVDENGGLFLCEVTSEDALVYTCEEEMEDGNTTKIVTIELTVRTVPPPLVNVTVHLSTILGLVYWRLENDGGYPVRDFTAVYRPVDVPENDTDDSWLSITPTHIPPNSRQIDVYHLLPNSSYLFRVWANNALGSGIPVQVLATTKYSDTQSEFRRQLLLGLDTFNKRLWVLGVSVVLGTLCALTAGTCLLLYRECRVPNDCDDDQDVMELVPNITLNPGFEGAPPLDPRAPPAVVICPGKYSRTNGSVEPRKV